MFEAMFMNISLMFWPLLADASKNSIPNLAANSSPYSLLTTLSCSKSTLFATNAFTTPSLAWFSIYFIQFSMFLNESSTVQS
jgi:hypothetical protein